MSGCVQVRTTATATWRGSTATATTASARTGSGSRARATVAVVAVVDIIDSSSDIFLSSYCMAGGDNTELSLRINDLQVESAAKSTAFQQIETKKVSRSCKKDQ